MNKLVQVVFAIFILQLPYFTAQANEPYDSQEIVFSLKPTKEKNNNGGILRLPIQKVVSGFIQGELLTINFTSSTPAATITISNQLTGEVEYTEICNTQSTVIDLSMLAFDGGGTYTIEVSTANWKRVGLDYN